MHKTFQKIATAGSDYLVGNNLEDLCELLEGGFLEGDMDFGQKLDSAMDEGEIEEKGMFKCEICGKECVSSRGLKKHQEIKHKNAKSCPEKVSKLAAKEFSSLVKRCSSVFQQDLCLPEDIRSKFGSFDFTDGDALELWKYLETIVDEFHEHDEKYYINLYGLLHEKLLSQKFEGDITVTNILLLVNRLLIHYAKSGGSTDNIKNDYSNSDYSAIPELEIKSLQYIAGYIIHKIYKRFKFTKKRNMNPYYQQWISILLQCKVDSDDSQTLVTARDRR